MTTAAIISIENPQPHTDDVPCVDYRHSKWVRRRQYVETVLLPQLQRMSFESATIFKAVVPPDYASSQEHRTDGSVAAVNWQGHRIAIVAGGTPCFLSHFSLWMRSVETGGAIFILEDDAKLDPVFEIAVSAAIAEFETGPYDNDVLYLQWAVPYLPTAKKKFYPEYCTPLSPRLMRVNRTNDLAGSAAYVVRPGSAQSLIARTLEKGTDGADAYMHYALNEQRLGVVVMTDYQKSFVLDDHWSDWNHAHTPPTRSES
jgi:GR25 family glycosyltransferase involved in LPS biosynthesis